MFGLNVGASIVPFFVSYVWDHGGGPMTLPAVVMASHLLPIPTQYLIQRLTATPAIVTCSYAMEVLCGSGGGCGGGVCGNSGEEVISGTEPEERERLITEPSEPDKVV